MTHEDIKKRFEEEFGIAFSHDQKCNCCPDLLVLKDATVRFLLAEVERAEEAAYREVIEELENAECTIPGLMFVGENLIIPDPGYSIAVIPLKTFKDLRSKFLTPKA